MSNKRAFVLGMLTVFGINLTVNLISDIAYVRAVRRLRNEKTIIVAGSIEKDDSAASNKEKEGA